MIDRELLAVIDDRIRSSLKRPLRVGTLVERTGDITGEVIEDGGITAMPVLVAGDAIIAQGDRVVMAQFGSDWVVLGGLTPRFPSEREYSYVTAGETNNSATYVDAPGIPSSVANRTIEKFLDSTSLFAEYIGSCFVSSQPTEVEYAVRLESLDDGTIHGPYSIVPFNFGVALTRLTVGRRTKILSIPAGRYDAKLQWRRVAGGTVTMNADDGYSFLVREVNPQA